MTFLSFLIWKLKTYINSLMSLQYISFRLEYFKYFHAFFRNSQISQTSTNQNNNEIIACMAFGTSWLRNLSLKSSNNLLGPWTFDLVSGDLSSETRSHWQTNSNSCSFNSLKFFNAWEDQSYFVGSAYKVAYCIVQLPVKQWENWQFFLSPFCDGSNTTISCIPWFVTRCLFRVVPCSKNFVLELESQLASVLL